MTQELDLLGLLEGRVGSVENELERSQQRVYGVTLGQVTDVDDPKFIGRVKVKFPWLSNQIDSAWARIATAWAGNTRGTYLIPEVGDEVLCAFEHGDLRRPYIVGFLWSDTVRPPEVTPRLGKSELRSKSGHKLVFDDLAGMQSLTIESQAGHKIVLDESVGSTQVSITDLSKNLSIVIDTTSGKISITSKVGQIELSATAGKISLDATAIDVHASGALNLSGDGAVVIKGATVKIN